MKPSPIDKETWGRESPPRLIAQSLEQNGSIGWDIEQFASRLYVKNSEVSEMAAGLRECFLSKIHQMPFHWTAENHVFRL